jgi:hypothetical protein
MERLAHHDAIYKTGAALALAIVLVVAMLVAGMR